MRDLGIVQYGALILAEGSVMNPDRPDSNIVDAFHEARFVGNDAAHDALAYSAEEIADIAELVIEAVVVLYVQPAQRAKMAQQRAARRAAAKQAATQTNT